VVVLSFFPCLLHTATCGHSASVQSQHARCDMLLLTFVKLATHPHIAHDALGLIRDDHLVFYMHIMPADVSRHSCRNHAAAGHPFLVPNSEPAASCQLKAFSKLKPLSCTNCVHVPLPCCLAM
jgi:hypothetical protein